MLSFQTDFSVGWILLGAALVLGIVGWLEFKRVQKYRVLRLIAALLAVVALAGLILKPAIQLHKTSDYILLTKNYSPKTLDSLARSNATIQRYRMPDAPAAGATVINNYRDLSALTGNIHLLGDGLPPYTLPYLDTTALHYYPSAPPEGFIDLNWRKVYKQNQVNRVEGIFQSAGKTFTLKLTGGGATQDSVSVQDKASHSFALKFTPKTSGNFIYTLSATDSSGKVVYTERVPLRVLGQKPLSVLVLSEYPTAEIRFLKNYLEAENHALTIRYTISKNKYRTEFINTDKKSSITVNSRSLAEFDLVIIDAAALSELPDQQLREIKQASITGLGILVLAETAVSTKVANFLDAKPSSFKRDTASLQTTSGLVKIPAAAISLSASKKITPILTDVSERIVAGYQYNMLGKIGFQLLTDTYRLQLAGKKEIYAEIWSNVLAETARQELEQHSLTNVTPFPVYEDEPIEFEIISATEKPIVHLDSIQLPVLENSLVPNIWQANAWAGNSGWNKVMINKNIHTFFVSDTSDWKAMRIRNQHKTFQLIAGDHRESLPQNVYQLISPLLFYLLFLLAAGFLWLAPKLS
jgi:hypothetical protein